MLDRIVPKKLFYFLQLIRFEKPIGFMLLLWPCCFALAILPYNQLDLIKWYLLFLLGSFTMRSAGCIINDMIDVNIDKSISRTYDRPLTSKKISFYQATILLIFLLSISFFILIQFNIKSIIIGLLSFPLIIVYPYMKRYTHWPQLILGIVFNWGIIIVSFQFYNNLEVNLITLYIGCIFWTLAYDTIYAYQDVEDDLSNNIKSTAVLFKSKGPFFVKIFYLIFMMIIGFLVFKNNSSYLSLTVITIFIIMMYIFLNKWKPKTKSSSKFYFKFNNIIGLFCFLYLLIF